ncbi:predicted protein [Nematostella vectensis]|uniref:TLDc domain-containing protein n=1 Tax=Nematostella vectensis TaxID=45351 RepID=A7SYW8_NEMVE|nr:predicted protein [Nematostella vectensis]|eukprot:XP_001623195.1 predicted protein [Nematostella vectensis]
MYCLRQRKFIDTVNKITEVSGNGRLRMVGECGECGAMKSKFIKATEGGSLVFLNSSSILMNASSLTLNYTRDLHTFLAPVLSSPTSSWRRCWHASSDGWAASKFRFLCEDKGPTVTIVEVGQYVFGGYADKPWTGCNCRVSSSKAFLFTLYNTQGYKPDKMLLKSTPDTSAIGDFSSAGPDFGRGSDLVIANNANSNRLSYTFPHSYHLPSGCTLNTCLAGSGSLYFTPSDVEVFYEVP